MAINLVELAQILPSHLIDSLIMLEDLMGTDADALLEAGDFQTVEAERVAATAADFAAVARDFSMLFSGRCDDWAGETLRGNAARFCERVLADGHLATAPKTLDKGLLEDLVIGLLADLTDSKPDWVKRMLDEVPQPTERDVSQTDAIRIDWNDAIFRGLKRVAADPAAKPFAKNNLAVTFHPLPEANITAVFASTLIDGFDMDGFHLSRNAFSFLEASEIGAEYLRSCDVVHTAAGRDGDYTDAIVLSRPIPILFFTIDPRRVLLRIRAVPATDPDTAIYLVRLLSPESYPDYQAAWGTADNKSLHQVYVLWQAHRTAQGLELQMGMFFRADPPKAEDADERYDIAVRFFYKNIIMPKLFENYLDGVTRFNRARLRLKRAEG
jgi:hypothetical protein